jgi:hypothetical protein
MLTRRALAILRLRGYWPTSVRGYLLLALCGAYVASLVLWLGPPEWVWGLLLVNVALMLYDWHAYATLGGLVRRWNGGRIALLVLLALVQFVMPGIVLVRLVGQALAARQREIAAHGEHIRQLEHDLGM